MTVASLAEENARLQALLAETQAALAESEEARRRLESIVGELRREKFDRKSEKLSPEQYNLPLEDVEVAQGMLDAAHAKAEAIVNGQRQGKAAAPNRNRGRLPDHLPRVERVIEPESTLCPCGCGEMAKIGEDGEPLVAMCSRPMANERLDVIPAQFRVLVTRRPRYACRRCSGTVVQAHAPEHIVPGGLPTEALIAQVIVAKFGDHLPFYRQAGIYARQGSANGTPMVRETLASGSTGRRSATGLGGPASIFSRSPETCASTWLRRIDSSWTRPPPLCSTPAEGAPRRASSGLSPATTGGMAAPARPSCCSATPPDVAASMPSGSCRDSEGGSCNATAMRATIC